MNLVNRTFITLCACAAMTACSSDERGLKFSAPPPPATRVATISEKIHGVDVAENYRWLEQDNPEVATWTEAQNQFARRGARQHPGTQGARGSPATARADRRRDGADHQGQSIFLCPPPGRRRTGRSSTCAKARSGRSASWSIRPSPGRRRRQVDVALALRGRQTARLWRVPRRPTSLGAAAARRRERVAVTARDSDVLEAAQWLPDGIRLHLPQPEGPRDPYSRQGLFHRMGTPPRPIGAVSPGRAGGERAAGTGRRSIGNALARRALAAPQLLSRRRYERHLALALRRVPAKGGARRPGW